MTFLRNNETAAQLPILLEMARQHIEDIESGIAEGMYSAAENVNLPDKKKALEHLHALHQETVSGTADIVTYANEIALAREQYQLGSDYNIEIDESPPVSVADDGVWVQAWVWVEKLLPARPF